MKSYILKLENTSRGVKVTLQSEEKSWVSTDITDGIANYKDFDKNPERLKYITGLLIHRILVQDKLIAESRANGTYVE